MDMVMVIDGSREAVRMALILGLPPLVAALLVGIVIGVVQTLTQMHEPVVGQIPRLAAVTVVVMAVLPWLLSHWVAYAVDVIGSIPGRL
jgi:flagellar biosynthesis protein FliQ